MIPETPRSPSLHAVILAAGRGSRLAGHNPEGHPKCLMEFGGRSLLARHCGAAA